MFGFLNKVFSIIKLLKLKKEMKFNICVGENFYNMYRHTIRNMIRTKNTKPTQISSFNDSSEKFLNIILDEMFTHSEKEIVGFVSNEYSDKIAKCIRKIPFNEHLDINLFSDFQENQKTSFLSKRFMNEAPRELTNRFKNKDYSMVVAVDNMALFVDKTKCVFFGNRPNSAIAIKDAIAKVAYN